MLRGEEVHQNSLDDALDTSASISSETLLTREVHDIWDELNSILQIYREQRHVGESLIEEYQLATMVGQSLNQLEGSVPQRREDGSKVPIASRAMHRKLDLVGAIKHRTAELEDLRSQAQNSYDAVRLLMKMETLSIAYWA